MPIGKYIFFDVIGQEKTFWTLFFTIQGTDLTFQVYYMLLVPKFTSI